MNLWKLRCGGLALTLLATAAIYAAYGTIKPMPLVAAQYCQACEAQEAACNDACEDSSHGDPDSAQACHDSCNYWLYEWTYGCWSSSVRS